MVAVFLLSEIFVLRFWNIIEDGLLENYTFCNSHLNAGLSQLLTENHLQRPNDMWKDNETDTYHH